EHPAAVVVADGGVEADGSVEGQLAELADPNLAEPGLLGQLRDRRLFAGLGLDLAGRPTQALEVGRDVSREPDRAALVGEGPIDRVPDPPGRVGREPVPAATVEPIDGLHQAEVALLDEI